MNILARLVPAERRGASGGSPPNGQHLVPAKNQEHNRMKNVNHLLVTAIVALVAVTAPLQTKASLLFNGTNSKAVLDGSYLDGLNHSNYTFEVWIKPFAYTSGTVFGKMEYWKAWTLDFTGPTRGLIFEGSWPNYYWGSAAASNSITANVWQHICCAVSNGVATFYMNGLQAGTENVQNPISFNASTNIGMMPPYGCDGTMCIGYTDSGTTPDYNYFNGLIYGIKVWSRTLASNEVYAIATTGSPLTTNGLYNAVMLNEGSGTNLHDSLTPLTGRVLSATWSMDNPTPGSSNNWLTNGQVAYYPFNGNANDESGFGDNGVVYGAQLCADRFGNTNQAYSFESRNLCAIKTAGRNLPIGSAARTFSLWFRAKPQYPLGTFITSPFFECGDASAPDGWFRSSLIYQGSPNLVTFYLQTGTNVWSTWKPGWDFAQWHQLVWVVPAPNSQTRLYVDGVGQAFNGAPAAGAMLNTISNVFWLGYGSGSYFDGALDDIRIYNRALSDAEVLGLYAAEAPPNSGPPVIVAQPQEQTVKNGGEAVFTVAANGQQPLLNQWQFNGTNLAGATNATLRLTNLQTSAGGLYSAVVSNTVGSVTSTAVRLTILSPIPGGPAPTNGLLAYYPFNGNANDESGNGANGTNYGAQLTVDRFGVANRAYYFNSTSLSAIAANVPGLPTNGAPRTVSLWYRSDWLSWTASGSGYLFGYGGSPDTAGWFGLRALSFNWITVTLCDGQWICGSAPTSDGQWHQAVLVALSNSPSLYLDGVAQPWQSFPPVGTVINSGCAPFQIGSYGGEYFDGSVDDVRIYNRALSQVEVLQLYAAEAPTNSGPPLIVSQPKDGTIVLGQNGGFSVAASGQSPLRYQWQFNGLGLLGATNPVLRVTNAQASSDGSYSVVISNALGTATSAVARLTVLLPVAGGLAPTNGLVAYYPFNGNANDESGSGANGIINNATLAADRFGTPNRAYHFSSTNLSGITATVSGLPTGGAPRTFSLWYRADWSSQTLDRTGYLFGYGGSSNVTGWFGLRALSYDWLSVTLWYGQWVGVGIPTADGSWHQAVLVFATNNAKLYADGLVRTWNSFPPLGTVVDSGGSPFQIGSYGTEYFDGSLDDIRIYNRALSQAEVYQLYNAEVPPPLIIATPPQSAAVSVGSTTTFTVLTTGAPPLSYQWRRDGIPLPQATNEALTLSSVQPQNMGNYQVVVTNAYGSVTSSVATLSISNVNSALWQGLVAYYPFNGNANDESGYGNNLTVSNTSFASNRFGASTSAIGMSIASNSVVHGSVAGLPVGASSRTISYWFKADTTIAIPPSFDHFVYGNWASTEAFAIVVTTNCYVIVKDVLVDPRGRFVTSQSYVDGGWHQIVVSYESVSTNLSIYYDGGFLSAAGYPYPSFNTKRSEIFLGSFFGEYPTFNGWVDDLRLYNRALSSNDVTQLYAAEVPPPPVVTTQPQSVKVAAGDAATFTVTATGAPPLSYQWQKNALNLPNATNTMLLRMNVQPPCIGDYTVIVSNPYGSVTSSVATLSISNVNSALWQGLVAYYPFNGNANDESGFGDHGVVQGAMLAPDRAGVVNSAYEFVATNHAAIAASGVNLPRANTPRTLSFWFKARPLNSRVFSVEYPAAWGNTAYQGATFASVLTSDNGLGVVGNFADTRSFAFRPLDDIWHQAVFTFAGGTNISGFLDGFNLQIGNTGVATLLNTASGPLTIGSFLNTGWFDGQIDDVRIYDRALSSAEAQELYVAEAGAGPRITNIVSAWVSLGQPATLSIMAVGGQPLSYQWFDRYDNLVSGATNASLLVAYACATNLGQYRVVVSNAWGMASASATLTVANPYSPVYLPLSRILPGSEVVTLVPNGNLELVGSTNAAGRLLPLNWTASGDSTLASGTNKALVNGNYVSAAFVTNRYSGFGLSQSITLEPNTEYVLSGYVWNMGDSTSSVNTALDAYDVVWDPQINLGPTATRAAEGYFVYCRFHSAASGTNVTIRAFYDGLVGNGASAAYYPLAGQWDNIAVTKASEFVAPEQVASASPWLTSGPGSRTVVPTSSLQMSVQAVGEMPLYFQWFHDGKALAFATNPVLTLANVSAQDGGAYTVVVTNAFGAITSAPALLTLRSPVIPGTMTGPITNGANGHVYYLLNTSTWLEAQSAAVQMGGNLVTIRNEAEEQWVWNTFSQIAGIGTWLWIGLYDTNPLINSTNVLNRRGEFYWVSGEPVTYSNWQTDEPNDWHGRGEFYGMIFPISRGTFASYWNDEVVDSTGAGIVEIVVAPQIVQQPQSQTVRAGLSATFNASASGSLPLSYQWRKAGIDVANATNATLTLNNAQAGDAGTYKLVVSNTAGIATSQAAALTVVEPVAIVGQPHATTVNQGSSANFAVSATGGGTLFYQWHRNGSPIAGAIGSRLIITNAQAIDDADYTVVVSNVVSSLTSASAHLLVVLPPSITAQPVSRTNVAGTTASFSVAATGTTPNYQWRKGGVNLADATSTTLALTNVASANAGVYDVVVWNPAGTNTSLPATLTVLVPAAITASPTNQSVLVSNSVTFSVVAIGTAPLRYQWRKGGGAITGATGNTYTIANVRTNDAGGYDVVVTNAVGSATSLAAALTVFYPPSILAQPTNTTAALDGIAVFSVVANGLPAPSYQWFLQEAALSGRTNAVLQLTEVARSDAGAYKVVVANPFGTVTSTLALLSVLAPLTLAEALNAVGYSWTTGGNSSWVPQTNVTADGISAAVSGLITDNQQTWVETTLNGPGQLTFQWKVSSEFGFDRLTFAVDGLQQASVSGEVDWTPQPLAITVGSHKLRWTYAKDGSESVGQDRAWLDQVTYVPAPGVSQPVYMLLPKLRLRDGLFQFDLLGEPGKAITVEFSTNLHAWSPLVTITNQAGSTRFVDPDTTARPARYYRIRTP